MRAMRDAALKRRGVWGGSGYAPVLRSDAGRTACRACGEEFSSATLQQQTCACGRPIPPGLRQGAESLSGHS